MAFFGVIAGGLAAAGCQSASNSCASLTVSDRVFDYLKSLESSEEVALVLTAGARIALSNAALVEIVERFVEANRDPRSATAVYGASALTCLVLDWEREKAGCGEVPTMPTGQVDPDILARFNQLARDGSLMDPLQLWREIAKRDGRLAELVEGFVLRRTKTEPRIALRAASYVYMALTLKLEEPKRRERPAPGRGGAEVAG